MGGGARVQGVALDPMIGMNDAAKPLRSKLLAVPALREKYLKYVREIAETWFDWKRLSPVVDQYVSLIEKEVAADTRKLDTTAAFRAGIYKGEKAEANSQGHRMSLQEFMEQRRAYLMKYFEGVKTEKAER
jgi:hypothetical protein